MSNPGILYLGPSIATDKSIVSKLYLYPGPIGCDVETISLEDRTPLGAAFAISPIESFYFKMDHPLFPWSILTNPNIEIVFHNSGFDVDILEQYGGITVTNYKDSLIAAQLEGRSNLRLGELCLELFNRPIRPITDLIGEGKDLIGMDKVPFEKVAERGCKDAQDCLEVWLYIRDRVSAKALDLETRVLPVALRMQRRGIRIDVNAVRLHRQRLEKKLVHLRMICEGRGFNPGSSMQLAAKLESLGYKVLYNRKTKKPKLDKDILQMFYSAVPDAVMTMQYRSTQTLLTHLIKPLDEGRYLVGDRIYPRVNLDVARNGRLSRSKPATQNIKAELRNIIIPTDGNKLYEGDFSQIEVRWAAYLWDVIELQQAYKDKRDIHDEGIQRLEALGYGKVLGDVYDVQRRHIKEVLFGGILYMGDERTLYTNNQIPLDVGKEMLKGYREAFPSLMAGIEAAKKRALDNGYTETYLGRRRDESTNMNSSQAYKRAAALRELVNHEISGSAAETMKEIMWLERDEPTFHTVHDSLLYDASADYTLTSNSSKVAPFETPFDVKSGDNWRDAKK